MSRTIVSLIFSFLVLLGSLMVVSSDFKLRTEYKKYDVTNPEYEVLYLPDGSALNVLSFGYKNVLSDYLWFSLISYFGKHFRTDQKYDWFLHYCNLIISLNPRASHVYKFGSMMMIWEVHKPEKGIGLLDKAIAEFPQEWWYYFARGITKLHFMDDVAGARDDLAKASHLPGAHPIVARLALKKTEEIEGRSAADRLMHEFLEVVEDPFIRKAVRQQLERQEEESKQGVSQ